jgi:hypothetical protein
MEKMENKIKIIEKIINNPNITIKNNKEKNITINNLKEFENLLNEEMIKKIQKNSKNKHYNDILDEYDVYLPYYFTIFDNENNLEITKNEKDFKEFETFKNEKNTINENDKKEFDIFEKEENFKEKLEKIFQKNNSKIIEIFTKLKIDDKINFLIKENKKLLNRNEIEISFKLLIFIKDLLKNHKNKIENYENIKYKLKLLISINYMKGFNFKKAFIYLMKYRNYNFNNFYLNFNYYNVFKFLIFI